jgi:hypothetical protein
MELLCSPQISERKCALVTKEVLLIHRFKFLNKLRLSLNIGETKHIDILVLLDDDHFLVSL